MQKKDGVRCEQVKYSYENKQRSDVSEIVEGAGCVKTLIQFSFHSNFELQRPEAECEEKRWFTIFLFLFFCLSYHCHYYPTLNCKGLTLLLFFGTNAIQPCTKKQSNLCTLLCFLPITYTICMYTFFNLSL